MLSRLRSIIVNGFKQRRQIDFEMQERAARQGLFKFLLIVGQAF
jgi:hypothetical protein